MTNKLNILTQQKLNKTTFNNFVDILVARLVLTVSSQLENKLVPQNVSLTASISFEEKMAIHRYSQYSTRKAIKKKLNKPLSKLGLTVMVNRWNKFDTKMIDNAPNDSTEQYLYICNCRVDFTLSAKIKMMFS